MWLNSYKSSCRLFTRTKIKRNFATILSTQLTSNGEVCDAYKSAHTLFLNTGNSHLYLYLMKGQLCPKYKSALRIRESLKEDCKANLLPLHSHSSLFQKQSRFPLTFGAVRRFSFFPGHLFLQ